MSCACQGPGCWLQKLLNLLPVCCVVHQNLSAVHMQAPTPCRTPALIRLALPAADCGGSWLADVWSSWCRGAQHPQDCLQDHRGELPAQAELFCEVSSQTLGCCLRAGGRLCLSWALARHRL